jgi:hypothetical protein
MKYRTDSDVFFPASVIKVLICNEAYKAGKKDGNEYLTEELADQILRRSFTFKKLVRKLPVANGRDVDTDLEGIVKDILVQANVPAVNTVNDLPLRVSIDQLFNYLRGMDLPEIMKRSMVQTNEDKGSNYGVPEVLLNTLTQNTPAYFKHGLVYDQKLSPKQLVNSYYFQLGDSLKVLGYAKGEDVTDVHEQMLQVAARVSSYAANE